MRASLILELRSVVLITVYGRGRFMPHRGSESD